MILPRNRETEGRRFLDRPYSTRSQQRRWQASGGGAWKIFSFVLGPAAGVLPEVTTFTYLAVKLRTGDAESNCVFCGLETASLFFPKLTNAILIARSLA